MMAVHHSRGNNDIVIALVKAKANINNVRVGLAGWSWLELIEFFSRNPGLVKWTGTALLLYFNTGSLDGTPMFTL